MSRTRWTIAAAVALLACLLTALPASAARRANKQQTAALAKAVFQSPLGTGDKSFAQRFHITGAKISTVSRSWATANVVPKPRYAMSLQGGYMIAVQPAGTKSWVVVDFGSADVGCGIAPDSVIADLLGIKRVADACPPGQGIR
jgi:hypothetical protein